jgi:hypothetical protein
MTSMCELVLARDQRALQLREAVTSMRPMVDYARATEWGLAM